MVPLKYFFVDINQIQIGMFGLLKHVIFESKLIAFVMRSTD
jgi:hypothetical protein